MFTYDQHNFGDKSDDEPLYCKYVRVQCFCQRHVADADDARVRSEWSSFRPSPYRDSASAPVTGTHYIASFKFFLNTTRLASMHQHCNNFDLTSPMRVLAQCTKLFLEHGWIAGKYSAFAALLLRSSSDIQLDLTCTHCPEEYESVTTLPTLLVLLQVATSYFRSTETLYRLRLALRFFTFPSNFVPLGARWQLRELTEDSPTG